MAEERTFTVVFFAVGGGAGWDSCPPLGVVSLSTLIGGDVVPLRFGRATKPPHLIPSEGLLLMEG